MALRAVALDVPRSPEPSCRPEAAALLCETEHRRGNEPDLFAGLTESHAARAEVGVTRAVLAGEAVPPGRRASGIYVVLSGAVRVYYTAGSGREIAPPTGRRELRRRARAVRRWHLWSGTAVRPAEVLSLRSEQVRRLMREIPGSPSTCRRARAQGQVLLALITCRRARSSSGSRSSSHHRQLRRDATRGGCCSADPHARGAREDGRCDAAWVSITLERFRAQGLCRCAATGSSCATSAG
jgi:hypothetical protein